MTPPATPLFSPENGVVFPGVLPKAKSVPIAGVASHIGCKLETIASIGRAFAVQNAPICLDIAIDILLDGQCWYSLLVLSPRFGLFSGVE